jgi:hypothetical protein
MATILNAAAFDAVLKVRYTDEAIRKLTYRNHPLLAVLPKMEGFGGKNLPIPIQYGTPQGRSAYLAAAKEGKYASNFEDFVLTRVQNFSYIEIDAETMKASMGDPSAFMAARQQEIDGMVESLGRDIALDLFKGGYGVRGRAGTVAAGTVTLDSVQDAVNFEIGQRIVATASATPAGSGALRSAGADGQLTAVNRRTGVLTGVGTATIAALVATDYLHVRGDASGSTTRRKIAGLDAWIPSTDPTAGDSHFGVDRSVDPTTLAGQRVDGTSSTVAEAIMDAGALLFREGGNPDIVVMNATHSAELAKELMGKTEYSPVQSSDGLISFDAYSVRTPAGRVRVLEDPNCPAGVAYMLQPDTWKLYSLGPAPHLADDDGRIALRLTPPAYSAATAAGDGDGIEVRGRFYGNLGCRAPRWNARISLAT